MQDVATGGETITVDGRALPVWPADQRLRGRGEAIKVYRTTFSDVDAYHPRLIEQVLAAAAEPRNARQYSRSLGGTKLYHLEAWDSPEARLVNARALAFYRRVLATEAAVVDIAWANVYRRGDYTMPHSHTRATASLVYCLDPGEPDPEDSNGGRLCFIDPRFPECCLIEEQRMTNPLFPELTPGTMLLFPGELVHFVTPYGGTRPRITASWNINPVKLPGSPLESFAAQA